MDLQEFNGDMLYFEGEMDLEVECLIQQAAENYGPESEGLLMKALAKAPENLSVLVGLYRYYYYQHKYEKALTIAYRVMKVVGGKIEFPSSWQDIEMRDVIIGLGYSFTQVRLYLFALKAAGYLLLRMGFYQKGRSMIEKVVAMDERDRIGAKLLLSILDNNTAEIIDFSVQKKLEACS